MEGALAVLYVEDDPDIRVIGNIALTEIGCLDVCMCANGAEALEAVKHFKPGLLLLDVMMAGMNGLQLLERLRQFAPTAHVPAIFMTARVMPQELEQYRALGLIGIVTKPFDPLSLASTLTSMVKEEILRSRSGAAGAEAFCQR